MPEFSDYLEGLTPVVGALSGDEILGASKDGSPVSLTPTQIANLAGGGAAASETTAGIAELATQAETNTGTDDARIVTPLKLANQNFLAPLASPALTGTPTAPTAAVLTDTTQIATTEYVRDNALSTQASVVLPGFNIFKASPLLPDTPLTGGVEFGDLGNIVSDPDDISGNVVFVGGIAGRGIMMRNMQWSVALQKYLTIDQDVTAHGSSLFEAGGEGASMHATPAGVNFGDVNHLGWLVSGAGPRGWPGYTSGYVNQTCQPIIARYESDPETGLECWNPSTATEPMLHFQSDEIKGSGSKLNEFLRIEGNSADDYGAIYFAKSRGTYAAKTATVAGNVTGSVGGLSYDGSAEQRTAEMRFVTRGSVSAGTAGQSIDFLTGATNTASNTTRLRITQDGVVNTMGVSYRMESPGSFTSIPDYSGFAGFSPVITNATYAVQQHASTATGGLAFYGLSTTSTASTALAILFSGVLGATAPTAPAIVFRGLKHNGTTGTADLAATEIICQFRNNSASNILMEMLASGNTGFGVTGPTAKVQVRGANNTVALLVEDDAGNDIISAGESGGARVVGFFGVTPVVRQVVATGSTTDQVITALQNLGLFSQT